jgi:septal ring factor EnvC (AmiA/AmiB activator)
MFGSLKIAMILILLAGAGGGFMYVKNLQSNLEVARANAAKLEAAVETSEASLKLLKEDNARLNALSNQLNEDLRKAEQYGDELRATLQKHNLTHLANKKPGLIEKRMQNATDKLWNDLESLTDDSVGVQSDETGTGDQNSNSD